MGRAATLIAAVLLVAGGATAQTLELRLAAHAEGRSLAGWTRLRDELLPRLAPGIDPRAALSITVSADLEVQCHNLDADAPLDDYLAFRVSGDRGPWLTGTETASGHAHWQLDARRAGAALPPALRALQRRYAYEALTGWVEVEVPATLGEIASAADELSTWLALDCGDTAALARPQPGGDRPDGGLPVREYTVRGVGPSGLLLPCLLIAHAAHAGGAEPTAPTALADDLARWLHLVRTARGAERAEAARQLGRFDDPRAVSALEALLWADGELATIAALSLSTTPHAAARDALWQHLPRFADDDPSFGRYLAAAILPPALRPQPARAAPAPADTGTHRPRVWAALLGGLLAGLLLARAFAGRRRVAGA